MAHVLFIQELLEEFEQTAKGDAGRKIEKKRNAEVKPGKNAKNTDYDSGGNRFLGRETQSPIKVKVPTEAQMLSDLNDLVCSCETPDPLMTRLSNAIKVAVSSREPEGEVRYVVRSW